MSILDFLFLLLSSIPFLSMIQKILESLIEI